ncbi:MAG TPA: MFS transporter [Thermoanaerobaculia bacterium]|jgi:multidrug resistance protein|nr:MFS transporter [Thermoanaerobaculia bacterium]
MESRSLKQISVLMATVFVDMIGFTIVLPLLPFYATRLGADASMVGILIAAFPAAQLVVSPFWGRLSDRYGRRPMILAGLLSSAAAYVLFGLANTLWLLFASRFVQGAGGATTGVVQAYVADAVVPEERTKALGWITAATSAGVMIGPLIGSVSTYLGPAAPGYLAAGLCLLNAAFAWKWLPEPQKEGATAEMQTTSAPRTSLRSTVLDVLVHPTGPISSLIWVYTIGMMGFMAMNGVLALFLKEIFGVTERNIGYFYTYVGTISLVMRGVLLGPAVRRFGEVGVTRIGALSLVIGLIFIPLSTSLWGLAVCVLFVPIGTALLFPATTSLVSRRARRSETGQVMGVQQLFGGVSRMLGPLWAGFVFERIGIQYPFWIAAALMLSVSFLTLRMQREAPIVPEVGEIKPVGPS